ncbi:MAG: DUF4416 family protein [Candidatus Eisenbacteria bacterium]|nr:DUF4416 family protein [Candidatus Eisenbacteria bacterium]
METTEMSRLTRPDPVLRVCSCLTAIPSLLPQARADLARAFGDVDLESDPFPFEGTDYYREEMGERLQRTWFVFRELCGPEELPDSRIATARIEEDHSKQGKRRINLDPGYLDLGKLVLASLKGAPDKIYLGRGVWAHTCLRYRFQGFEAPDHSFPDFKDGLYSDFFSRARQHYKRRLPESS